MIREKLTLEEAWKYCMDMWEWISENYEGKLNAGNLKKKWLKKNRIKREISHDCFFCEYASQHGEFLKSIGNNKYYCSNCPGTLISKTFHCENHKSYHWIHDPKQFYKKLTILYIKFLKEQSMTLTSQEK